MSLEAQMAELTAALKDNTAAHTALANVAKAATAKVTAAAPAKDAEAEKPAPKTAEKPAPKTAEKPAEKAAPKVAPKAAPKKKAEPILVPTMNVDDLRTKARAYLEGDDAAVRDAKKANLSAAFDHLGVAKLGEIESDEDRARLAAYLDYWAADLEVDFEALDEKVVALQEAAAPADEEEEDMTS